MLLDAQKVETAEDMVRAFHFPRPREEEFLWFLAGAFAFGILVYLAFLLDRSRKKAPPIMVERPGQRRADVRVSCQLEAQVLPNHAPLPFMGMVIDLSAGGISIVVDGPVPVGTPLRLRFEAEGEHFETLRAEVTRSEPATWSRRHYLHCRFLNLTPGMEQRLLKVVAARERELLHPGG